MKFRLAIFSQILNRLGWAAAIANWTPNVLLLPVSGPGKTAYLAFDLTETLNRALLEQAPDKLRMILKKSVAHGF